MLLSWNVIKKKKKLIKCVSKASDNVPENYTELSQLLHYTRIIQFLTYLT